MHMDDDRAAELVRDRVKGSPQAEEAGGDDDEDDPYAASEERFRELKDAEKQERLAEDERAEREEDEADVYDPEEEGNILH